jgi:hypothetical protein
MEDGVTTNEFYYLVLVLGAFAAFAVGTSLATIQYKTWLRRQAAATVAARRAPDKDADRARRINQLADAA